MIGFLLRIARAVLQNVLSQLTQQVQIVQQAVLAPIRQIVGLVSGGTIWRGDGATKFTEVVSREFVPGIGLVGSQIQFTHTSLMRGLERMEQADAKVKSLAGGLGDIFGRIYSG
jgi:hypothetical protein